MKMKGMLLASLTLFVGRSHADSLLGKSKEGIRFEDIVSDADRRHPVA